MKSIKRMRWKPGQIRVLMAERNWTQQDLADMIGYHRVTVNRIMTGRYLPSQAFNSLLNLLIE